MLQGRGRGERNRKEDEEELNSSEGMKGKITSIEVRVGLGGEGGDRDCKRRGNVRHSTAISYPSIENLFNGCQGHPLVCPPPGTAQ
jgi:hypothetical protein